MPRLITPLLLLTLLLGACSAPPAEEQIRNELDEAVTAIKARKPREVIAHLTEDFLGQQRMTQDQVRAFMVAQFFRNQNINIVITGLKINVTGDSAEVNFRAVLSGGQNWLPDRLDYYEINSGWVKQGGDWLIQRADWKPVLAD